MVMCAVVRFGNTLKEYTDTKENILKHARAYAHLFEDVVTVELPTESVVTVYHR